MVTRIIEPLAEVIVFPEAHEVDANQPYAFSTAVSRGAQCSAARERPCRPATRGGFRVELRNKDMGIVISVVREASVVILLGAAVIQLIASLTAPGHGSLDHSSLLKLTEQLSARRAYP